MNKEIIKKQNEEKFNIQMISIIICSVINTIVGLFSGTFLVASLYNAGGNPIVVIAEYYLAVYASILVFYYILSHFGENVKIREWFFRIGIILKAIHIFMIVLMNDKFYTYIILFAVIRGISDAFYWSSYSLMRYSIVRRKMVNKFTFVEQFSGKTASIVFPIILGSLIDVESFVKVAFPVLILSIIQIIFSFFVRSSEVKSSKFDIFTYWKKIKEQNHNKQFAKIYMSFFVDGTRDAITQMITIFIMMFYNSSNTSLGIISSIISICSLIILFIYTTCQSIKNSKITYILMCVLPFVSCLFLIFKPCKITLIIYNICFSVVSSLLTYGLDTERISIVKLLKYHGETLEHNVTAEIFLDNGRFVSYIIMLLIGLFGGEYTIVLFRVSLLFYIIMFIIVNIMNYILAKDYNKILEEHKKEKEREEQLQEEKQ